MARVLISTQTLLGPHPASPSAGAFQLTFTGADEVSGNYFALTAKEVVLIRNTHSATSYGFTLASKADPFERTGDLTGTVSGDAIAAYYAGDVQGWKQSDGGLYLSAANSALQFAILKHS
jgi:hypothetical protein